MNIMELGAIGELVGGVAVIATLVYLAMQVRHSAATGRVTASSSMSESFNQVMSNFDVGLAHKAMMPGIDALSPEERFAWAAQLYITYCHLETMFFQARDGLLDPNGAARAKALIVFYQTTPGVQSWWHGNIYDDRDFCASELFTPEFRDHVEEVERSGLHLLRSA